MFINLLWFIISLGVKQAQIKVAIPPGIIPDGCVKADNETDQVFLVIKTEVTLSLKVLSGSTLSDTDEIEPLGLFFLVFYFLVILIQFTTMLWHRMSTFQLGF